MAALQAQQHQQQQAGESQQQPAPPSADQAPGIPVLDARGSSATSTDVAAWLRQVKAAGWLATAVRMPHHTCAAEVDFASRVMLSHQPVAFPALGCGGFCEAVVMRTTGFAQLMLLELAVAKLAAAARDSISTSAPGCSQPLDSMEAYAAFATAVRFALANTSPQHSQQQEHAPASEHQGKGGRPSRHVSQQQRQQQRAGGVMRVPYIYSANPCDVRTSDESYANALEQQGLLARSSPRLTSGYTWLTASPAAQQAAAADTAAGSSRAAPLPPAFGVHSTNKNGQCDLDAAARVVSAVSTADASVVQLLDDGLGRAVQAYGSAMAGRPPGCNTLEANLFGILLPVMIVR